MISRSRAARALLPLLFFCGSATAAGASWRDRMSQAERLSDEGRNEEAAATARDALEDAEKILGPEAPEIGHILARLGRFYEVAGAPAKLPEIERRLSAMKSKDFEVWKTLGMLRRDEGKSAEAEDALKKALAFKPTDSGTAYELARVYDDMGRFEDEILLLKKTIEKNPRDFSDYIQLANAYARLGRSAEAKKIFARARKIDGMTADAYIEEGHFYLHSGELDHAEEAFKSAIAVDTASPFGYHHMGSYLSTSRQYPEAEKYLRRALELLEANPTSSANDLIHAMQRLGDVIAAQGRYREAEAVYLKSLEKAPPGGDRQLELLHLLGNLYVSQGKSAQAEEAYERAAAACGARFVCGSFSFAGDALIDLGEFYLSRGRRAEAEVIAERAEKFSADVPIGQGFDMLKNLAAFYAKLGDVSKREALYARLAPMRRAAPFNPDLVWVETGLADIDEARGRFHEAEERYRRAIGVMDRNDRRKEEADMLDRLAAIYEKEAKHHEAIEAKETAKFLRARSDRPALTLP